MSESRGEIQPPCDHSWRVEGDDELEPMHYRCEDCGREASNV